MTIIVFLVDTSASMNQRAYLGGRPSLLDVAKGAVETFVKMRQRSPESRGDRYMLLSFEEAPYNVKAAWKENLGTFMNELKNLQATGVTTFGAALKASFDLLNMNRMQTGIDMYGQGRYPFYLEPAVIVALTDGGKMTNAGGVQEELVLPMTPNIPGAELTREPFRWDQRLFSLVLRLTGTPPLERDAVAQGGLVPIDSSPIETMCEVTGGRSYAISSHRMLMQCVESLVQKIQSGVVVYFEKIGPDPPLLSPDGKVENGSSGEAPFDGDDSRTAGINSWHCCRKMIYVPRSAQKGFAVGFWPMPEAFWPDTNAPSLPPRSAHPIIKFTCTNQEPMVIENLPFDKYEVEPCPLTRFILSRKQASTCWQVFMGSSSKNTEIGYPFGYLKASSNLQSVNLYVMPYNYPALLPLLDDLFKVHRLKPNSEWRTQFANYLRTMPPYYAAPLRRALTRMGASNIASSLIPETLDNSLSYSVVNYLKRLKNQAKAEFDRFCSDVGRQRPPTSDTVKVAPRSTFRKDFLTNPNLSGKFAHLKEQLNEFLGFSLVVREREIRLQSLRNPFDIPRASLLDQVARMRANFLQPSLAHTRLQDNDHVHSMPVSQMGNYQEYLKRIPPALREIESTPVRQHMFGNPFKIDKRMMVDEADIDLVGGGGSNQGTGRVLKRAPESMSPSSPLRSMKRKPGPLSRDFVVKRPLSPLPSPVPYTPPASPVPPDVPAQTPEIPVIEPVPVPITVVQAPPPVVVLLDDPPKFQPPELEKASSVHEVLPETNEVPEATRYDHVTPDSPVTIPLRLHNGVADNRLPVNGIGPPERKDPPNGLSSMSKAELHEIQQHNNSTRVHLFKLVRRPGKKYEEIFRSLTQLRGPAEMKKSIALEVITECLRFKRRLLADLVTQWMHNSEAHL